MRRLLFFCTLFSLVSLLQAQNTFSGVVTDRKGEPIPNVKIQALDSEQHVLTNLDGTFTLATLADVKQLQAVYIGMKTKTFRARPFQEITLRESSTFGSGYHGYKFMLSLQGVFPFNMDYDSPAMGLSIGQIKNFGWYTKVFWTTNNNKSNYIATTIGGMVRLGCPLYFTLGIGVIGRSVSSEYVDGNYYKESGYPFHSGGLVFEPGLLLCLNDYFINLGTTFSVSDHFNNNISPASLSIGVGYCF